MYQERLLEGVAIYNQSDVRRITKKQLGRGTDMIGWPKKIVPKSHTICNTQPQNLNNDDLAPDIYPHIVYFSLSFMIQNRPPAWAS
jgi:hypothetical protein